MPDDAEKAPEPELTREQQEAMVQAERDARVKASRFKPLMEGLTKFTAKTQKAPLITAEDIYKLQEHVLDLEEQVEGCAVVESFKTLVGCTSLARDIGRIDKKAKTAMDNAAEQISNTNLTGFTGISQAQQLRAALDRIEEALVKATVDGAEQCLCKGPAAGITAYEPDDAFWSTPAGKAAKAKKARKKKAA